MRKANQSYGRTMKRHSKVDAPHRVRALRQAALRLGRQLVRWDPALKKARILWPIHEWTNKDLDCVLYALEREGCSVPRDVMGHALATQRAQARASLAGKVRKAAGAVEAMGQKLARELVG